MAKVENISKGTEVYVPQHFKPRGTTRVWDRGIVLEVNEWNIADVQLDNKRVVHAPVGILHVPPTAEA